MNQISETCSLCNKPNDQMLMLSCVHDPCINCAASAYAEQIHIKGQGKDLYICQICGEQTLLDTSTIAELAALASSVIRMPTKKITPTKNAINNTVVVSKKKQTQQPLYPSNTPITPSKKIVYYCKDHSQQQISYYCFSCWSNICPQCAIHGSHKDHQVKLIKKAISQVKSQYMDIVGKIGDSQNTMSKMKEGFLRLIKETNDRHSREKNTITREFDIIRATLASKEKQLIKELEEINKHNLATLTNFLEVINTNYEETNKLKRSIELIHKKDEVLILQDYRKIGQLQHSLSSLNKTTESITGQSSHLNIQFLQQECKQLTDGVLNIKANLKREQMGASNSSQVTSSVNGSTQ